MGIDDEKLLAAFEWIEGHSCKVQALDLKDKGLNGFAAASV